MKTRVKTIKQKLLTMLNLQLLLNLTTKQVHSYMANRSKATQQVKYVGNTDVFIFGFNFMSPKRTRTKHMIVISPSLQAYWCLPLVQRCYGFHCTYPEVLIAISLVLIVHGNENPFQHVLVCKFCI